MAIPRIDQWAQSKWGFYVDRHYRRGKWVLRPGPIELASYHADILRHVFTPDADGRLPYDVIGWAEPTKSGKSAIAGLVAEYAALHLDGDVFLASNKRDQARSVMFRSLTDSVEMNPHLPNVDPARYEVTFSSGNTVRAIASNAKGEAGARFSLFVVDEPWGYVYEDAIRLWAEFKTDPTRLNSVKLAVGYGGYANESDLWQDLLESCDEAHGGEPVAELAHIEDGRGKPACWRNERTFVFWSHWPRQPWQTERWIESQRRQLRAAQFSRMLEVDFAASEQEFIPMRLWDRLVDSECYPLMEYDERPVWLGADAATKRDAVALVGCTRAEDKKRVELVLVRQWHPENLEKWAGGVDLDGTLGREILRIHQRHDLRGVLFDPFQMASVANRLERDGAKMIEMPQTSARTEADQALYDSIVGQRLAVYDSPELRASIGVAAGRETDRGYRFHKRSGDDLAVALSMAHWGALRYGTKKRYPPMGVYRY